VPLASLQAAGGCAGRLAWVARQCQTAAHAVQFDFQCRQYRSMVQHMTQKLHVTNSNFVQICQQITASAVSFYDHAHYMLGPEVQSAAHKFVQHKCVNLYRASGRHQYLLPIAQCHPRLASAATHQGMSIERWLHQERCSLPHHLTTGMPPLLLLLPAANKQLQRCAITGAPLSTSSTTGGYPPQLCLHAWWQRLSSFLVLFGHAQRPPVKQSFTMLHHDSAPHCHTQDGLHEVY
jgi:hypothetical protein